MAIIKTSELTGVALDWAVAKCEGGYQIDATGRPWIPDQSNPEDEENGAVWFEPSSDWSQGGTIIKREKIRLRPDNGWSAALYHEDGRSEWFSAVGPLIAAMRCYVASKMGDEVEVPDELVEVTK